MKTIILLSALLITGCASVETKQFSGTTEQQIISGYKMIDSTAKDFVFGAKRQVMCHKGLSMKPHTFIPVTYKTNIKGTGYTKRSGGNAYILNGKFLGKGSNTKNIVGTTTCTIRRPTPYGWS